MFSAVSRPSRIRLLWITIEAPITVFNAVVTFAFYILISLVYISAQGEYCIRWSCQNIQSNTPVAILSSRVYALYGNKKLHLEGLIFLCCILPAAIPFVEIGLNINVFEGLPCELCIAY